MTADEIEAAVRLGTRPTVRRRTKARSWTVFVLSERVGEIYDPRSQNGVAALFEGTLVMEEITVGGPTTLTTFNHERYARLVVDWWFLRARQFHSARKITRYSWYNVINDDVVDDGKYAVSGR